MNDLIVESASLLRQLIGADVELHERIANQRKDFLNKLAHNLTTRYDRIALEDLVITRMVHGNLAKTILDAGWGYLVQRLTHKAASASRVVVLVDPRNSCLRL